MNNTLSEERVLQILRVEEPVTLDALTRHLPDHRRDEMDAVLWELHRQNRVHRSARETGEYWHFGGFTGGTPTRTECTAEELKEMAKHYAAYLIHEKKPVKLYYHDGDPYLITGTSSTGEKGYLSVDAQAVLPEAIAGNEPARQINHVTHYLGVRFKVGKETWVGVYPHIKFTLKQEDAMSLPKAGNSTAFASAVKPDKPKTTKSKLKAPEGWKIIESSNRYYAVHTESKFQTRGYGEKSSAVAQAIYFEQQRRHSGSFAELPNELPCLCGHPMDQHEVTGKCAECPCEEYEEAEPGTDEISIFEQLQKAEPITNSGQSVVQLPLHLIQPSPENPRKHFDETELAELSASIRENGVEIPIAVLPKDASGIHILIYGERRWRASKAAEQTTIPALILHVSEERANELRLNENLQRKNLTPLEEAAAFQLRMDKYGKSVADIAVQSGMHSKTIAKRLRLILLPDSAKTALEEGRLKLGPALQIARLADPAHRQRATDEFLRNTYSNYWQSETAAHQYIERTFFTLLSRAPFKTTDLMLVPEAGSCVNCPKRTGNQADLFADIKNEDTCLDRSCYDAKCNAHLQREIQAAKAKGLTVLDEKEVKKIAPYSSIHPASGFVDLAAHPHQDDKNRSWSKLLGKDAPAPTIAVVNGEIKKLVPIAEAAPIVNKKYGIEISTKGTSAPATPSQADERRAQKARKQALSESITALHAHIIATMRGKLEDAQIPLLRILAEMMVHTLTNDASRQMTQHYDLELKKNSWGSADYLTTLLKQVKELPTALDLFAFFIEGVVWDRLQFWAGPHSSKPEASHLALCQEIGFDLKQALKTAADTLKPKVKELKQKAKAAQKGAA